MRPSIVSRSVIAVATLGIGSVALAAVPATAATPSGITREQVLTAAAGVRSAPPGSGGEFFYSPYGAAGNRAIKAMVNRTCSIDPEGPEVVFATLGAVPAAGSSADGLVVTAVIINGETATMGGNAGRLCTFGALAAVAPRSTLSGSASLTGAPATPLSGDAFITPAASSPLTSLDDSALDDLPTFSASGNAVQSDDVKVADKKTKKEKKAAKTKYDKRLKALKKAYTKALDKAGSSKSKKKTAKAAYRYAIAGYKIITTNTPTPFNVTAKYTPAP